MASAGLCTRSRVATGPATGRRGSRHTAVPRLWRCSTLSSPELARKQGLAQVREVRLATDYCSIVQSGVKVLEPRLRCHCNTAARCTKSPLCVVVVWKGVPTLWRRYQAQRGSTSLEIHSPFCIDVGGGVWHRGLTRRSWHNA